MTCSISPMTVSPSSISYLQAEEKSLEKPSNSTSVLSLVETHNQKDLTSRAIVALSNTNRNVAVIETIRFLAIVGLVCSVVTSVLLPALGCAAIAAGACVLKNRAIQLDAKALQPLDKIIEDVSHSALERSPSQVSLESKRESGLTRTSSTWSNKSLIDKIGKEEEIQDTTLTDVKEVFLNSLGPKDNLNVQQRYELLAICYLYLLGAIEKMPKSLKRKGAFKAENTEEYFKEKYNTYFKKSSQEFQNSFKMEGEYAIFQANEKQKAIKEAAPSFIMEIVQELHLQLSTECHKHGEGSEYHAKKAKHAGEYVDQLKESERQKNLTFTEDIR